VLQYGWMGLAYLMIDEGVQVIVLVPLPYISNLSRVDHGGEARACVFGNFASCFLVGWSALRCDVCDAMLCVLSD
jgi:hypothetical protein